MTVEDFDPAAPPASIRFAPARLRIRLEGALPAPGTVRAHAEGILPGGKKEVLYFNSPMTHTQVDAKGSSKTTWRDKDLELTLSFSNPPYTSLKLWVYAGGCQSIEGRDLGPMAAEEQRDLTLQLLPDPREAAPVEEELKRQAKEVQDGLLPRLLANDWSVLQGGALDEAFLKQVWGQGGAPPDLAQAASSAGRNVRYVQDVIQKGVGPAGLTEFKAEGGAPAGYTRWGALERFQLDLVFTRDGSKAGFGVYVYRLGAQVRYDVYGVYAPKEKEGDRP